MDEECEEDGEEEVGEEEVTQSENSGVTHIFKNTSESVVEEGRGEDYPILSRKM